MNLNVETLGQVFTELHTVNTMLSMRKNKGSVLEPSCGNGSISNHIDNVVAIEMDEKVKPSYAINMDFFNFSLENKFDTIIGNPPFVKYKDFLPSTKKIISDNEFDKLFDERSNLYLFFIYKCIMHLNPNGELIFINPREFLNATSSIKLNNFLYSQGSITEIIDTGDSKLFGNFTPNCVIWRFQKNLKLRTVKYSNGVIDGDKLVKINKEKRTFENINGQLVFYKKKCTLPFKELFYVKVGAVSGADNIFASKHGNKDFVFSGTHSNGKLKKFFYNIEDDKLLPFKDQLLKRKIKKFNEKNWFMWGRNLFDSKENRIYVNCKTRKDNPFFYNKCKNYDGSVLGLFPINKKIDIKSIIVDLNNVDWKELGFNCDGRFIFSQKALENCMLPDSFKKYFI